MRYIFNLLAFLSPAALCAQITNAQALPHKGEIFFQRQFEDKSGSNIVFASVASHPEEMKSDIYLYQYVSKGGTPTLVWDIQDFGTPLCEMSLNEESVQIIDLDRDGFNEVSFIYQQRCDGLDPYVTKLILHSKGKKYAIRGLIAVEDGAQIEKKPDATLESATPSLRNFAHAEWTEFVAEGTITTQKSVYTTGSTWTVFAEEDLMAGGSVNYKLVDLQGNPPKVGADVLKAIHGAEDVSSMPDPSQVLYASVSAGVGIVEPASGKVSTLMTFLGDTEGLSMLNWSPDKKKVAFVALNHAQYPKMTRIFVLTLEGNT